MYRLLQRLLFLLPPEPAHHLGLWVLRLLGAFPRPCAAIRRRAIPGDLDLSTRVGPMTWPTPIGVAAGLDKDAVAVRGLFALGFGAVEVGTLTPRPQPGNPKPRLFRIPEHRALINRMGFNNDGADAAALRLERLGRLPGALGVNVGKNKDTPLERAEDDYVRAIERLGPWADYVVVNASSPNTPGLRQLQEPEALGRLLRASRAAVDGAAPGKPLFLKIAPDLSPDAVDQLVDVAIAARADGLIATNTTISRPLQHPLCAEAGGLSGAPVGPLSTEIIRRAFRRAAGRLPIIGVGGVFTAADAYAKLRAGACAVQLYTGFIYGGPGCVAAMLRGLAGLLRRDGLRSVSDAIGADAR